MAKKRIYLDVCCWNRPFDDQSQARVHLEAEAVLEILAMIEQGRWRLITSEAVDLEIEEMSDATRRERLKSAIPAHQERVQFGDPTIQRAVELERAGFPGMDAVHPAAAEQAQADVLLTTDDRLLRLARRHTRRLRVVVHNPLTWLQNVLEKR